MRERDSRNEHASLWGIDDELAQLPMSECGETTSYSVRIKARVDRSEYHGKRELYPLFQDHGTKLDLTARAYILIPALTLEADVFDSELSSGAIGNVVSSRWEGMKHHEIARLRSLYYQEENALAIWEIDDFDRLDIVSRITLWQGFEHFLVHHYPKATRIYADDAEPGHNTADNQKFLEALGYSPEGTTRIFAKGLLTPYTQS
jgi:hypothetical protein